MHCSYVTSRIFSLSAGAVSTLDLALSMVGDICIEPVERYLISYYPVTVAMPLRNKGDNSC